MPGPFLRLIPIVFLPMHVVFWPSDSRRVPTGLLLSWSGRPVTVVFLPCPQVVSQQAAYDAWRIVREAYERRVGVARGSGAAWEVFPGTRASVEP